MAANVLFDAPGPRARARYRIYNVLFGLLVIAAIALLVYKFNQAGQFEARIYERLSESGTITEFQRGLVATLKAAGLAIVVSLALGMVLVVGRLSERAWLRLPAAAFVEFFRAIPLVLLLIFLLGLASAIEFMSGWDTGSRGLLSLVTGLTLYNGSVLCEVFRAGINAVPKGQSEAAYAVGMRKSQVLRIVTIPQGVKYMLPAIISQCVVALKDTSLGFIVLYPELLRSAKTVAQYAGSYLITFGLVALIYIAMNSVLSGIAYWLQRRSATRGAGSSGAATDPHDVLPAG